CRQHPATPEYRSVPQGEGWTDPFDALERSRFSHGDFGSYGVASLQPVPERIHNPAWSLRRRLRFLIDSFRGLSGRDLLGLSCSPKAGVPRKASSLTTTFSNRGAMRDT